MMRFLQRLAVFSIPFGVYFAFIVVVDPFAYLNIVHTARERKIANASALNQCFWKMNEFRQRPVPRILLGDSRMLPIRPEMLLAKTGDEYFNFAYGGSSLQEMIETFWFASRLTKLREVYVGLNLNVYNDYNYTDRTAMFTTINTNPALYLVNRTVLRAAVYDVYSWATRTDLKIGVPNMSREAFWQEQLGPLTAAYYTSYVYPNKYKRRLDEIGVYCKAHGIRLRFIIFPTHVELQNRVHDFHLERAAAQFRQDLAHMGQTFDFDYQNDITSKKENFSDPYHYTEPIVPVLVREVWLGQPQYARVDGNAHVSQSGAAN